LWVRDEQLFRALQLTVKVRISNMNLDRFVKGVSPSYTVSFGVFTLITFKFCSQANSCESPWEYPIIIVTGKYLQGIIPT
jgi:hypothetical protein